MEKLTYKLVLQLGLTQQNKFTEIRSNLSQVDARLHYVLLFVFFSNFYIFFSFCVTTPQGIDY